MPKVGLVDEEWAPRAAPGLCRAQQLREEADVGLRVGNLAP